MDNFLFSVSAIPHEEFFEKLLPFLELFFSIDNLLISVD